MMLDINDACLFGNSSTMIDVIELARKNGIQIARLCDGGDIDCFKYLKYDSDLELSQWGFVDENENNLLPLDAFIAKITAKSVEQERAELLDEMATFIISVSYSFPEANENSISLFDRYQALKQR